MPNIKSAKKRVKLTEIRNLRNKNVKTNLKTTIKAADAAVLANSADKEAAVKLAIKKVDQAAAKGLMHKKTAARRKSSLARKLNKVG